MSGEGSGVVSAGFHEPVLGSEVMELMDPTGDGLYLDGTVGGGGHARLLLERCPGCRLLAVDRDPAALSEAQAELAPWSARVRFRAGTFHEAAADPEVRSRGLEGALLDLGVSSHQLDEDARGFTFRRGAPLDMRMESGGAGRTAADLLAGVGEAELAELFRSYGEEPRARRLAREVVRRRTQRPFRTSDDLVAALSAALGRAPTASDKARIFQALRIAVNEELDLLEAALPALRDVLRPGGVFAVISWHSLEDRIVKNAFREWSRSCVCPPGLPVCVCRGAALGRLLTRGPVRPTSEEVERNPRARSALLRAWRRAA